VERKRLQIELRDLAMFNLAIDSKLRGCDVIIKYQTKIRPILCTHVERRGTRWTSVHLPWNLYWCSAFDIAR
jgi:hypothetical protein